MEECKKTRTLKARKLTRRTNELLNALKIDAVKSDIEEKIRTLKFEIDELGTAQDALLSLVDANDKESVEREEKWYYDYDVKTNLVIKEASMHILNKFAPSDIRHPPYVRLKKSEIPKFDSNPKTFYKWKSIFERYTKECDEESKYEYLLTSTVGESFRYVENRMQCQN